METKEQKSKEVTSMEELAEIINETDDTTPVMIVVNCEDINKFFQEA